MILVNILLEHIMSNYDEIPDELIEYVEVKINGYFVKKGSNNGGITFGKFNSLKEACAAACILSKNNWKLRDLENDSLIKYGGEFWIFKVKKNKLVFDNKFKDYESAVEYMEINSRCNDYHNDIFSNSLKKKGYNNRWKSSKNDYSNVKTDNKYIFEDSGKFIVNKSKGKNSICYGEFESIEEAIVARQILLDSKWVITTEYEISFHDNFYWIFEVSEGVLTFKGKFQSYEDVLDIINPPKSQKKEHINPFIKSAEDYFKEGNTKIKSKSRTSNHKSKSKEPKYKKTSGDDESVLYHPNYFVKRKSNIKSLNGTEKIWSPYRHTSLKNKKIRIFVERCGDNVDDLVSILDFNFYENYIQCIVDGEEINWNNRDDVHISNFTEFGLICDILEVNGWSLSKINNSSSIHFYNSSFYKVHVVKNTIVFGKFLSYNAAENTLLIYKGAPLDSPNHNELGIDSFSLYYEFTKFQGGLVYKTVPLSSLEEIKAIRDILIYSDYDFDIFYNYDLFYLNGMYWDLECSNNVIRLNGRYELIKIR